DTPALRERLTKAGVACLEADVRFAMRYLIDRQIKGALRIHGEPRPASAQGDGRVLIFDNPEIEPATARPRLTVLSLDIETDPRTNRLLSIALAGAGAEEVLLLARGASRGGRRAAAPTAPASNGGGAADEIAPAGARLFASEADLVRAFV